jgi:general secretion pathway protein G
VNVGLRSHHAGFSLIEVLVVVTILGILAAIVAIGASNHLDRAREAATRTTIENVRMAITAFEMALGRLPKDLAELIVEGDEKWPGPFLDAIEAPRDGWGNDLKYEVLGKRVRVTSPGKDRQFGTGDDLWK